MRVVASSMNSIEMKIFYIIVARFRNMISGLKLSVKVSIYQVPVKLIIVTISLNPEKN